MQVFLLLAFPSDSAQSSARESQELPKAAEPHVSAGGGDKVLQLAKLLWIYKWHLFPQICALSFNRDCTRSLELYIRFTILVRYLISEWMGTVCIQLLGWGLLFWFCFFVKSAKSKLNASVSVLWQHSFKVGRFHYITT